MSALRPIHQSLERVSVSNEESLMQAIQACKIEIFKRILKNDQNIDSEILNECLNKIVESNDYFSYEFLEELLSYEKEHNLQCLDKVKAFQDNRCSVQCLRVLLEQSDPEIPREVVKQKLVEQANLRWPQGIVQTLLKGRQFSIEELLEILKEVNPDNKSFQNLKIHQSTLCNDIEKLIKQSLLKAIQDKDCDQFSENLEKYKDYIDCNLLFELFKQVFQLESKLKEQFLVKLIPVANLRDC